MSKVDDEKAEQRFDQISAMDSKSIVKPSVLMLILSQSDNLGPNVMTAAWWTVASFDPFRYLLSVETDAFTHEIIEENPEFVMAIPSVDMADALTLSGKTSGRNVDKIDVLDLETVSGMVVNVPLLSNAVGNIECRVTDSIDIEKHTLYLAEVASAHVQPGVLDGRIISGDSNTFVNLGSDWVGEDDRMKHRFYLDFADEDIKSFSGDEFLGRLPPKIRKMLT